MAGVTRRNVLKAAATVGAVAVFPGLEACTSSSTNATTATTGGAKSPPANLTGRIVRPADADYTAASTGYDELVTHYPLVIVFAQQTQDVVNALTWARPNDVALRLRRRRHSPRG